MSNCINESYQQTKNKEEYTNRVKFISKKDCCDYNSCDLLSREYEILKNKCNDLFRSKYSGNLDEKFNIKDATVECKKWKEMQDNYISRARTYRSTRSSHSSSVGIINRIKKHWVDFFSTPMTKEKWRVVTFEYGKYKRINAYMAKIVPEKWTKKNQKIMFETDIFIQEFNKIRKSKDANLAKTANNIAHIIDKKVEAEENRKSITERNTQFNSKLFDSALENIPLDSPVSNFRKSKTSNTSGTKRTAKKVIFSLGGLGTSGKNGKNSNKQTKRQKRKLV
jgi:hypothetical protein